jgi:uncharacterized Rossmann fold enzyme
LQCGITHSTGNDGEKEENIMVRINDQLQVIHAHGSRNKRLGERKSTK